MLFPARLFMFFKIFFNLICSNWEIYYKVEAWKFIPGLIKGSQTDTDPPPWPTILTHPSKSVKAFHMPSWKTLTVCNHIVNEMYTTLKCIHLENIPNYSQFSKRTKFHSILYYLVVIETMRHKLIFKEYWHHSWESR